MSGVAYFTPLPSSPPQSPTTPQNGFTQSSPTLAQADPCDAHSSGLTLRIPPVPSPAARKLHLLNRASQQFTVLTRPLQELDSTQDAPHEESSKRVSHADPRQALCLPQVSEEGPLPTSLTDNACPSSISTGALPSGRCSLPQTPSSSSNKATISLEQLPAGWWQPKSSTVRLLSLETKAREQVRLLLNLLLAGNAADQPKPADLASAEIYVRTDDDSVVHIVRKGAARQLRRNQKGSMGHIGLFRTSKIASATEQAEDFLSAGVRTSASQKSTESRNSKGSKARPDSLVSFIGLETPMTASFISSADMGLVQGPDSAIEVRAMITADSPAALSNAKRFSVSNTPGPCSLPADLPDLADLVLFTPVQSSIRSSPLKPRTASEDPLSSAALCLNTNPPSSTAEKEELHELLTPTTDASRSSTSALSFKDNPLFATFILKTPLHTLCIPGQLPIVFDATSVPNTPIAEYTAAIRDLATWMRVGILQMKQNGEWSSISSSGSEGNDDFAVVLQNLARKEDANLKEPNKTVDTAMESSAPNRTGRQARRTCFGCNIM